MKLLALNSKTNPLDAILFEFGHHIHHHFVLNGFVGRQYNGLIGGFLKGLNN